MRWAIPAFLMLTGFFMLDPSKKIQLKTLFSKNILRIFTSLVFWALFYGLYFHRPLYPLGNAQEGHLWYLGMVLGVYLALPVLRIIASNHTILKYFSIVWFSVMCYNFIGRYAVLPINFSSMIFVAFSGCAVFAYYLKTLFYDKPETPKRKKLSRAIYIAGIISLIITLGMGVYLQEDEGPFFSYESPFVFTIAAALLVFCIRHPLHLKGRIAALVENCSKCTFGIYLIHVFVLAHICTRVHRFVPQPILMTIICVFIAFFVSYGITFILKKIPLVKKYIV